MRPETKLYIDVIKREKNDVEWTGRQKQPELVALLCTSQAETTVGSLVNIPGVGGVY